MKISVIGGTGYVGLTTAVCLASEDHLVFCVGRDKQKIDRIRKGLPIIYEEKLEKMLKEVLAKGKLKTVTNIDSAIQKSDISFICVGTPSKQDGSINLTQIEDAVREVGCALATKNSYHVVVVKSTVVPGTTEELVIPVLERFSGKRAGVDFGVCMNPEFLREGSAIQDFLFPKDIGIVIGELDKKSGNVLCGIYEEFNTEIMRTSIRAAEMIKYARNAYLAKDVSFANEIANICQKFGVDYLEVKRGMEMDVRIGKKRFLNAGVGFGGSCFPKDVRALVKEAIKVGIKPRMLEATLEVNNDQPYKLVELVKHIVGELNNKKIAVLGLAFKPGTDDVRDAPSIKIVKNLLLEGANVHAYDPKALDNARKIFDEKVHLVKEAEMALSNADACLIITEWPEFADLELYDCMRCKVIVDGRRMLDPNMLPLGFTYYAIGFPVRARTVNVITKD